MYILYISPIELVIVLHLAQKKGFNLWLWFFAALPVGLLVVPFLPSAKTPYINSEIAVKCKKNGNNTAVLTIVGSFFLMVILFHLVLHSIIIS